MLRTTRSALVPSLFLAAFCAGCVDAPGEYDAFQERDKATTDPVGSGCGDPNAACDPPVAAVLRGQWLFGLAATLGPKTPILFFADVEATDASGTIEWTWTLRPLDSATRLPLDALPTLTPSTVPADGKWVVDLDPIAVPGAANPITGSDIEADAALTGDVCSGRDFFCGEVTGQVTKPVTLNLQGSKWTMARLPAPDTLPETIYVSCLCAVADPPEAP